MKLKFHYGDGTVVLPAAVADAAGKSSKLFLSVLLALAADPALPTDVESAAHHVSAKYGYAESDIRAALSFWQGAGILETDASADPAKPAKTTAAAPERGLPNYSSGELAEVLKRRRDLGGLINACQQEFGKIFSTAEISIVAGIADYLNVDGEYLLLLLAHCARMGKKSLRYVEKMALSLYDEGVTEVADLEARLVSIEQLESKTGFIRSLFGISSRALTSKEKGMVENWLFTMKFEDEMIRKAYEITVDTTGKASLAYVNSILERWHAAGYRTTAEVDAALTDYRAKKGKDLKSFDINDAFEAALKRTYGEQ